MAEQEGRWVTVNGAHVFLKDGESENPFANLKKTVNIKDDSVDDIAEHSRQKVRATREFIEQTVKDINDFNSGKGKKDSLKAFQIRIFRRWSKHSAHNGDSLRRTKTGF